MFGPDWTDVESAKRWMEQRYIGSAELGSPLYQYLRTLGDQADEREEHLSTYELGKWLSANKIAGGAHYPAESESLIFYPEYKHPAFSSDNKGKDTRKKGHESFKARDKTSRQRKPIRESRDPPPSKTTAKKIGHQSKGAMLTEPKAPRQLKAQGRALRPSTTGRKHGKTGRV